jgi:hypothetical protein
MQCLQEKSPPTSTASLLTHTTRLRKNTWWRTLTQHISLISRIYLRLMAHKRLDNILKNTTLLHRFIRSSYPVHHEVSSGRLAIKVQAANFPPMRFPFSKRQQFTHRENYSDVREDSFMRVYFDLFGLN